MLKWIKVINKNKNNKQKSKIMEKLLLLLLEIVLIIGAIAIIIMLALFCKVLFNIICEKLSDFRYWIKDIRDRRRFKKII